MIERKPEAVLIREYGPNDLPIIGELDRTCFPLDIAYSHWEMLCLVRERDSIVRVAEQDGKVIGFAIGSLMVPDSAHVLTLDVDPSARCRRIGTALMNTLHEEFRRNGATTSILEVDVANIAARRFYEGLRYS